MADAVTDKNTLKTASNILSGMNLLAVIIGFLILVIIFGNLFG